MKSYNEFCDWIFSFEEHPLNGQSTKEFKPNDNISAKVDGNGGFKPFFGDTVVFDIDERSKQIVGEYADKLYQAAGGCFADRLITDTLHMTLHDLSNSPELSAVSEEMDCNKSRLLQSLAKTPIEQDSIVMQSTYVFNSSNTSMVLGLMPKGEAEYEKLMSLYGRIDEIKHLGYSLVPHITLAYYRNIGFDYLSLDKLIHAANELSKNKLEIILRTNRLYYQRFTDMNSYNNIFSLAQPHK
ncbi:MAG: hypothetical protein ACI4RP_00440 [Acutalibacteraceae bacterium]